MGPPRDGEGGPKAANVEEAPPSTNTTSHRQATGCRHCNGSTRPRGRYDGRYDPWRAGFRRGAIDALRLACRRIDDPHVWMVLSELRECYETERWPGDD